MKIRLFKLAVDNKTVDFTAQDVNYSFFKQSPDVVWSGLQCGVNEDDPRFKKISEKFFEISKSLLSLNEMLNALENPNDQK